MSLMYKMWKGEVALDFGFYFHPRTVTPRRGHKFQLFKPRLGKNSVVLDSIFFRGIDEWNHLDEQAISSDSSQQFKEKLYDQIRREEGLIDPAATRA